MQNNIQHILENNTLIPVVTFSDLKDIESTIQTLLNKNIFCIEVTLRTPCALDALRQIKRDYSNQITLGVGTVIQETQIEAVKEIGVDFMVSPATSVRLLAALEQSKIPYITGVATPSDILLGIEHGCSYFKFFPANLFGGVDALKTYAQLFPEIKFCPTGGLNETTYADYLSLPNVISVGGSWMLK
jgi:2-dehydro-3-deoxyphosphogluconate aldolase/(4S)-4-hydroxy-2-oxoglutarate aldolase